MLESRVGGRSFRFRTQDLTLTTSTSWTTIPPARLDSPKTKQEAPTSNAGRSSNTLRTSTPPTMRTDTGRTSWAQFWDIVARREGTLPMIAGTTPTGWPRTPALHSSTLAKLGMMDFPRPRTSQPCSTRLMASEPASTRHLGEDLQTTSPPMTWTLTTTCTTMMIISFWLRLVTPGTVTGPRHGTSRTPLVPLPAPRTFCLWVQHRVVPLALALTSPPGQRLTQVMNTLRPSRPEVLLRTAGSSQTSLPQGTSSSQRAREWVHPGDPKQLTWREPPWRPPLPPELLPLSGTISYKASTPQVARFRPTAWSPPVLSSRLS
mmetsp:Transcript_23400/g.48697  ORF Transcript_23400/g.48697 Transcript_23400/m.48697 type:complete len:319 (-) Transcript_23400:602-1558(-)